MEMLVRGAVQEETHCTGGISEIDLSENDITYEGLKNLSSFPKQLLNKLETLDLRSNKLNSESCETLAHLIPHMPHLKKFELSFNPNIGQGGTIPLMTSLTTHNSLERLVLCNTGIAMDDSQALSGLLSSSKSLKELDIRLNDLPPQAVELIINGLHHNTTLAELYSLGRKFPPMKKLPRLLRGLFVFLNLKALVELVSVVRLVVHCY